MPFLYIIVPVYTHECAEKCQYLNIKEQTATSYRSHSGLIWMQGTHECIIRHVQTLQMKGEHLQHFKPLLSLYYIPPYVYRHVSVLQILLKNMNVTW